MKTAIRNWKQIAAEYGPLIRMRTFGEEFVILNNPEMAEKLLSSKEIKHMRKPAIFYDVIRDLTGDSLIMSKGQTWHSRRKLLDKGFTYTALRKYMSIYNSCSKRFITKLADTSSNAGCSNYHQINSIVHSCGFEIITEMVMGLNTISNKDETDLLFNSFNKLKEAWFMQLMVKSQPWLAPIWKLYPSARKYKEAVNNISSVMIDRCQAKNDIHLAVNNNNESFSNILTLLLKSGLSNQAILDEVKTMIVAGYDTSSATIHFVLFMLALHQNHQVLMMILIGYQNYNTCRKEIDRVFDNPTKCSNGYLSLEALSELKYLERCIHETLRMFPASFIVGRKLELPLKIDEDLEIPVGTNVVVSNLLLHGSSNNFPNPEEFQPRRFLPENCVKRHPFAYLPFSAGPRGCIGMKFSLMETKTVVVHVLREFHISTRDTTNDVALIPSILLRPQRDYIFLLKKRTSASEDIQHVCV
ncbi:Cytochrome P450 4C1 [Orchesella cincta]|uniref:Cytochrome P450 4C1 n=1 Tax=Orchesella cincta TaxID=48709 RepID=A0A1D2MH18_ORCCI|nr:Cytochrome P450 4C1 [Orchesella cincta]